MARHVVASIVVVLAGTIAAVYAGQSGRPAARALTTQDFIDIQQLNARYAVAIDE